jgi:hypothetical protein
MNTSKIGVTILVLLVLALLVLAGAFGLVIGLAQPPRGLPTSTPVAVIPTAVPTQGTSPGSATIAGRAWHDLCAVWDGEGSLPAIPSAGCVPVSGGWYQANGVLEIGEPLIGGVFVQLGVGACPASGLATATTDTTGAYGFTGLDAGTYCVSVDVSSPQNVSLLPGSWTAPGAVEGSIAWYTITLRDREQRADVDFGWDYRFLPQPESPSSQPSPTCADKAAFVSDVTIPDNTRVLAGNSFVKTWRLRNSGTCPWTADYALVFADGQRMGGPDSVPLPGPVAPGEAVDLSVKLTAPASDGTYEGKWQLRNADGVGFGTGEQADGVFWVRIVVGDRSGGWRGEYYANRYLSGGPSLTRSDGEVFFIWDTSAPAPGLPPDGFSVRWTRNESLKGGLYRFYTYSDDGVRVWLDGELIIDQWHDVIDNTYSAERTLTEGEHSFRVDYYENTGAARIRFWWVHLGQFPQWQGDYFANTSLLGEPKPTRNDTAIDFNWGRGSPAIGLPSDGFSVRWRRVLIFEEGMYRFRARVDDGMRLWVDGTLVIDAWKEGGVREVAADYWLPAGNHALRVEYFERTGDALIQLWWERLALYPDWKGEYWTNRSLKGSPALVRNDRAIDFEWGRGAPAAGLPADEFSARWTREVAFEGGVYRFHAVVDDGVRVYVGSTLLIDDWRDGGVRAPDPKDVKLSSGNHTVRVEYYERGGEAVIQVWWTKMATYPDWKGEYWPNRTLEGMPVVVRNDETIDFRWGPGAPALGLPEDDFAARWTRKATFKPGVYRFHALADDGIRVYVDGKPVINEWHTGNGSEVYTVDLALRDEHKIVVEYYERGGEAMAKFWWRRVGDWPTPTPVPPAPTPTPTPIPTPTPTPMPAPNQLPVAVDDLVTTDEDTLMNVSVLTNDFDPDGDPLTVSARGSSSTKGGKVSCAGGGICTYAPPADFNGIDSFSYTIDDGKGGSASATVTVVVNPVNDPPAAVNDSAITDEGVGVDVNVLANDSDPDGDNLVVSTCDDASVYAGVVECVATGACTYTPSDGFAGIDTFGYTISDGKGGIASATVSVTVIPKPSDVWINELLPEPTAVDWNGDGVVDSSDEWIELHNPGSVAVDIGGWSLAGDSASAIICTIPSGMVLEPGAFVVVYRAQTGIELGAGQVRLSRPDGEVEDEVTFSGLGPDASYSRDEVGTWHVDWTPSPGAPNLAPAATALPSRVAPTCRMTGWSAETCAE